MKRKLSLFLAFIMILGILPINVFATKQASVEAKNDKAYEEVTIDGMPYKVYKVADLIDKPTEKNTDSLMFMSKSTGLFNVQGTPTPAQPYDGWKFYLKLVWETIDRPIDNVNMPVYFGDPRDSRAIKLGHFIVTTGANQDQYIEMELEYTGTNPSIDFLVENGYANIKIAIPEDMRYDFVLASTKWDESTQEGTAGKDNRVVFNIEGRQSVMHGYGIKWFDTDSNNRDKVDARWEGKENQTSDVKLGTEDRNYSTYDKNTINPQENINKYPDGTQYTKYDYYYNGKKITTHADADNTGKFTFKNLAISKKSQAPYASLKVKDGNDYKLKGEKVLKNNTKYLYNSVGDYRTFHVLSMREALEVKFNTGKGFLNENDKTANKAGQNINVKVKENNNEVEKDFQEIGHSEKIKDNESGRTITFPDGSKLIPPTKAEGQKTENEFKGWNTDQNATTALTQDQLDELVFTEKTTTFYAIYGPKDEYRAKVEYVYDDNGTEKPIDKKYLKDENDTNYLTIIKGNNAGDAVKDTDIKVPTFIGFERTNDNIDVTGKTYKNEKDDNKLDVIKVKFKKLDSVIPEKDPSGGDNKTKPDGYKTVTFKAGDNGKINGGTEDVKFFVNPKDDVKFGDSKIKVPTIEALGDYKVKTPNWNPDLNDTKKEEKITDNAEFVAQYEAKAKHTVTFNADNGTENTTEQVVDGKTVTKPATDPTKKGYTFKEWQKDGAAYEFNTPVKSDITLKAAYTENQVKIEYESEDTTKGTVTPADETLKAATGTPTGSTAAAANGYRFTHWTKDGDNNFKVNTAKVTPEKTNDIYVADKFTAHFAKEVSVKYDLNAPSGLTAKGTAPSDNAKYIAGEKATVLGLEQGSGVDGCEFLGWSTDKNAKTATYKANDKIDIAGEEDVTLHAIWKKGTKTVKLSFEFYKKKDTGNTLQPGNALGNFKKPELKDITGQEVGVGITLPTYQGQTVNTGDLQGTWTFDGWYKGENKVTGKPTVSPTDADNQYVGKWILEETKTAKVTRNFVIDPTIMGEGKDVPTGHTLPDAVKVTQKVNETENYIGSTQTPGKDKFNPVEEKIGDKVGTWTFKEWNPKELTVNEDESKNVFTGTWTWTEKGKVNVNYVFDKAGTTRDLPKDITDLKPEDLKGDKAVYEEQVQGKKPNLPATTSFDVVEDGNKVGTWTAGTWSNATKVDDNNYKYTLVWTFTEVGQSDQPTVDPVKPGDKKPEPTPEPQPVPEVEIPGIKIRDHYTPTYPVYVSVPDKKVADIFTHERYIFGYPDDTIRPDGDMTRAEAIAVVARLQKLDLSDKTSNIYKDTKAGMWYNAAINAAFREGYLLEKEGENIRPNDKITRAELALLISHIDKKNDKVAPFEDVKGHKFEAAINQAYGNERIKGYPDGTFKPDNSITRAEVATMLNKLYDRYPDKNFIDANQNLVHNYKDMSYKGHWGYYELVEAYHTHKFTRLANNMEEWKAIIK